MMRKSWGNLEEETACTIVNEKKKTSYAYPPRFGSYKVEKVNEIGM